MREGRVSFKHILECADSRLIEREVPTRRNSSAQNT